MNLKELIEKIGEENIRYEDLLQTDEWFKRRKEILEKDDSYCTKCGLSETLWHAGKLVSFDKKKFIDTELNGERITADFPIELDRNVYLHIHHKYYVMGRLPWEYNNDELTTLCNCCHWALHQNETVKIFQETTTGLKEKNFSVCSRCNGAGVFPEYSHVQAGICFNCHGARYEELIELPKSNWFK